jgi:hypothetical protein
VELYLRTHASSTLYCKDRPINGPFLAFLPEKGNLMGGTLGDLTPSCHIRKQMLNTKYMGSFKFQNLSKVLDRMSALGVSTIFPRMNARLNGYSILMCRARPAITSMDERCPIYIVIYVNEFSDAIDVQHPEPGSGSAHL